MQRASTRALTIVLFGVMACEPLHGQDAVPDARELEAMGARIGSIFIDAQNVFDPADPREDKALYRLANDLHVSTRDAVVRQQLLFREGDPYSRRALAESERILRTARYLFDASIRPIAYRDGIVDVIVSTRDVWTLSPGISFGRRGGRNTGGLELEELNILGTGSAISAAHTSGIDRSSDALEFHDPHLGGSWTSLTARYVSNSDGSTRELAIGQPFYALDAEHAFGVRGLDDERIESLYDRGHIIDQFSEVEQLASAHFGWSDGLRGRWARRWSVGVTYDLEDFEQDPAWQGASMLPEDRELFYPWVGFSLVEDEFVIARNRDQIGRTEDFHLGADLGVRVGWAGTSFGSDRDALMLDATASRGFEFGRRSTLLLSGAFSTRIERGELRDALIVSEARYYLRQSPRALFFATVSGTLGHDLDLDNQVLLGGDNGLRGYPLRYQSGNARALLTIEQRYFTDWYPFRLFHIGGAAFADIGRTWGDAPFGSPSLGTLRDVGIGLRIGNTRSGLGNIIHVDLAFPLDGDASISSPQILVESKQRF